MTYRKKVTYRCNVRRYAARNKIHPVRPVRPVHPVCPARPVRPALPDEKFIINYNGELWNARDYARFVNSFIKWERENEVS